MSRLFRPERDGGDEEALPQYKIEVKQTTWPLTASEVYWDPV